MGRCMQFRDLCGRLLQLSRLSGTDQGPVRLAMRQRPHCGENGPIVDLALARATAGLGSGRLGIGARVHWFMRLTERMAIGDRRRLVAHRNLNTSEPLIESAFSI